MAVVINTPLHQIPAPVAPYVERPNDASSRMKINADNAISTIP
jgi:hypothetical protein